MSRYNGQAPHGYNEGYNNYDPAADGWTHTGSNDKSRVDFYERDNTRMDYYPTTGTVKTSMNHPAQGPTQMFRRGLDADSFGKVCNEPRHHTGQGYQTKANQHNPGK
ncbi:MAG: hypothetical protein FRX49_04468 [Trebouxia sp. A1-2]|nr:MAG: hypothetical protein FRX49_04468 [Trebouxia sp. A1-2]